MKDYGFNNTRADDDNLFVHWQHIGEFYPTICLDETIRAFENEEVTSEKIGELAELAKETAKIEERERKYKIKEKAEKAYYGKVKTKRQVFSKEEKENILAKFDYQCALCGAEEGLHIHHKDHDPKNNQINNLIVLCGVCHKKIHMKVR